MEIGSHINDWNLDAPELQPVFAVSYNSVHYLLHNYNGILAVKIPQGCSSSPLNSQYFMSNGRVALREDIIVMTMLILRD